jgi:hypothetical protein
MALIPLLAAAALTAQPARLVLGKDASAELTLDAPAKASVEFSTSVGSVSEAVRKGDVWTARFTAPKVHSPSVALVLAEVDVGGDRDLYWLAIPLAGSDTMEIETRPGSQVEAMVAGSRVGPVTADKNGAAKLSMVVPPGVERGTLRITDKLGNSNEKPLDLEPPPFTRLRMAARDEAATADGVLELEIFVVRPDGTPDEAAQVDLSTDAGEVKVRKSIGPGVYLAEFSPPPGKTSGSARLTAKVPVQSAMLEVPVRPAGPTRLWQATAIPQRPWGFSAGAIGALGATFSGGLSAGGMLEAALRLRDLPLEGLLDVGGSWFNEVVQGAGPGTTNATSHTWLVQAGVRASRTLSRGIDGHAAVLVGLQDQLVHVRSVTVPAGEDHSAVVPRVGFALGASMRAGPGRVLAQVQLDASPSGEAQLQDSLGGAQLQIGYLIPLR